MRNLTQNLLSQLSVVIFVLLVPLSFTGGVQQANAQGMLVQDIRGTIQNTLQTISAQFLEQKEIVWDGLFFNIAQQALQQMVGSMIEWVNSGFDGEPAFITNYDKHFQDISDEVAGEFIYGDELSTLCEPFQLDVRVAVAEKYQKEEHGGFKEEAQCTVDDMGDQEAFLKGDFYAGGWEMWMETILNPQNTSIGAYLMAESELIEKTEESRRNAEIEAIANQGFKSQKVCTGDAGGDCDTITTPGIVIKEQLANALNAPMQSLINADEMNEVIGSLFGNLANQAFQGINGLLGLGGNSSFGQNLFGENGGLSYLDAIREEGVNQVSGGGSGTGGRIAQALKTQTRALDLQLDIVSAIDDVNEVYKEAHAPYIDDSCWNLEFPTSLEDKLAELLKEVPETIETIIVLEELSKQYENANSTTAELEILREFSALQTNGLLTGQTSVIQNEFYFNNELKSVIDTFKKEITAEENSC